MYISCQDLTSCPVLGWVLAQKKIKEGWWFYDQSTFVVFTYSLDHIKENLPCVHTELNKG